MFFNSDKNGYSLRMNSRFCRQNAFFTEGVSTDNFS